MPIGFKAIVRAVDRVSPLTIVLKVVRMVPAFVLSLDTSWGRPNMVNQFFDWGIHIAVEKSGYGNCVGQDEYGTCVSWPL